jgi:alkyl sulfatase BDS1-like metallo-beta-lactamase superfamily hydrolase
MVLKQVVFAQPTNTEAKELLADAFEQMGYQAESGPWRAEYLQAASELRHDVPTNLPVANTASPDTIRAMPPELLFDYFGVRLDGPKAAGKRIALNVHFTDLNSDYSLVVEDAVLNYSKQKVSNPDATITMAKSTLDSIELKELTIEQATSNGSLRIDGNRQAFTDFVGLLDTFPFWFNIVTP